MTLESGVEDGQLPQSIDELGILGGRARGADCGVEAPEELLECVVVSLAVAAGKIGVATRRGLEQ